MANKYPNDYEKTRYGRCSICGKGELVNDHHKFPQSKPNCKLYPEYIHRADNLVKSICVNCHADLKNESEKEFCMVRKIKPRSKSGQDMYNRDPWPIN